MGKEPTPCAGERGLVLLGEGRAVRRPHGGRGPGLRTPARCPLRWAFEPLARTLLGGGSGWGFGGAPAREPRDATPLPWADGQSLLRPTSRQTPARQGDGHVVLRQGSKDGRAGALRLSVLSLPAWSLSGSGAMRPHSWRLSCPRVDGSRAAEVAPWSRGSGLCPASPAAPAGHCRCRGRLGDRAPVTWAPVTQCASV